MQIRACRPAPNTATGNSGSKSQKLCQQGRYLRSLNHCGGDIVALRPFSPALLPSDKQLEKGSLVQIFDCVAYTGLQPVKDLWPMP